MPREKASITFHTTKIYLMKSFISHHINNNIQDLPPSRGSSPPNQNVLFGVDVFLHWMVLVIKLL